MRGSKLNFNLDIDDRTNEMSEEALFCRSRGHKWGDRGITRKRYAELLADAMMEDNRYCENGCGSTWRQVWSLRTGEILVNDRDYPKGGEYRAPKGQGRVLRAQARIARFARSNPRFV